MPRSYRHLAAAALVIVGGLFFSQVAPAIAGLCLLPSNPTISADGMADHFHRLHLAGTTIFALWLLGLVGAASGVLYGLMVLALFTTRPAGRSVSADRV